MLRQRVILSVPQPCLIISLDSIHQEHMFRKKKQKDMKLLGIWVGSTRGTWKEVMVVGYAQNISYKCVKLSKNKYKH